jgi:hypothetical protein
LIALNGQVAANRIDLQVIKPAWHSRKKNAFQ